MGSSLPFSTTRVYHDWFDITTSLVYITLKFPGGMCLGGTARVGWTMSWHRGRPACISFFLAEERARGTPAIPRRSPDQDYLTKIT
jgi:hypothetical protein